MYDVHQDGRRQVYVRAEDWDFAMRTLSFAVRTERPPDSVIPDVQAVIRRIDPRLAMSQVRTMNEIVDEALSQQRLGAVLIGGFALGALLLAAMGLFGVVSGSVTRRRHELAMRLVLGADYGRVLRLVLGEGALLVGLGVTDWRAWRVRRGRRDPQRADRRLACGSADALLGRHRTRGRRHDCLLPAGAAGAGIDPARSLRL